jgi:TonB-linked SusC/RagA family outer membrane protein
MKKVSISAWTDYWFSPRKTLIFMKFLGIILFSMCVSVHANVYSQQTRVTLEMKNTSLNDVLVELMKQSKVNFLYNYNLVKEVRVDVKANDEELTTVLAGLLPTVGLEYFLNDGVVVIRESPTRAPLPMAPQQEFRVEGRVLDHNRAPLPGVSVRVDSTSLGTSTDVNGRFTLRLPVERGVLVFSFVGFKTSRVPFVAGKELAVVMEEEVGELGDVVVTGIFTRQKESFTGSSSTYSVGELKAIGSQNVLQSLKTLDPSFAIIESNEWGSDPNRLPDINVRGKTSVVGVVEEYREDPNQPLFILDGFESTLSTINDLSMDRVESITVLKDAAATAIYGAKAANGVIVVETKAPVAGILRLNYNGTAQFSFADLTDYNLMNASEKLEFEKLAGYFYSELDENGIPLNTQGQLDYNARLAEIRRGVDSYWMSEPLRFATTHGHTLYVEGGDQRVRYGVGFSYKKTAGVMMGSNRDAINGNFRLIYRYKNLSFNEYLNIDYTYSEREKVAFARYSEANPYYRKRDENGEILKVMDVREWRNGESGYTYDGEFSSFPVYNPLYDNSLSSYDRTRSSGYRNNLEVEWRPVESLRLRGRFSISLSDDQQKVYRSPYCSDFIDAAEAIRGRYTEKNTGNTNYDGDFSFNYGELLNEKHMLSAVGGLRMSSNSTESSEYTTRGFIDDRRSNPAFSTGFLAGTRPAYLSSERRSASFYLIGGYAYGGRYLLDANIRSDGASVFGASRKFSTTWSVGVAWNLHAESFIRDFIPAINMLKLRYSVGNPGNQNFEAYIASNVYDYVTAYPNPFGLSATILMWGNPNLAWQKTIDNNYGIDIELFNRRLKITADYFSKNTDPLLLYIPLAPSTGDTQAPVNAGKQLTTGFTGTINATIIQNGSMRWNVNFNARHLKYEYGNIEAFVTKYNNESKGNNLTRFYDGGSKEDLWAVRSAGIDPATGREIFIKKDGTQSFVYDFADEVVVGNSTPDLEGVFGTSFYYKGFTASLNFRYRYGGQIFLKTLYDKVENITVRKLAYNQDRRALYDRWKNPGDVTKFKTLHFDRWGGIVSPISSRFVANENTLTGESFSLGYETSTAAWLKQIGASSMTVRGYMNDIFRVSTVLDERGLSYPFARSFSLSLGLRF